MTTRHRGDELGNLDDTAVLQQLEAARRSMSRELLRDPVVLARALDPTFRMRPHLRVIGDALGRLEVGEYDRLMIFTPPQVGKSTTVAEWFPFWWLCLYPMDRIAVTSYGDDLALRRGKTIRGYVEEYGHEYDLHMQPGSGAMQDWSLTRGGGVRSVSVGKGLTGHPVNCVSGDVPIRTPLGTMPIGAYAESGGLLPVLAYDHAGERAVWAPVVAASMSERETLEIVTRAGRAVCCTPEHRFYVPGRGYVAAVRLRTGDPLLALSDSGSGGTRAVQGGRHVLNMRRRSPQAEGDSVALVRPVRGGRVRVYDLQVEGTRNFFAGEVLVHNCLIVDDPHKDRADAESEAARRALHDWYSSTALKRLQPDRNAVVGIQTRWHPDDWAGRRLADEGRIEDGGRWKVVHLPAIADPKFGDDPLGRNAGDPLPHPKIPTRDRRKLAAWWAEMKATSIVRDWHSLAQGDPQPAEGALVSDELLRLIRGQDTGVEAQKIAVAIDPSGGGRDIAGVIGGYLGDDGRVWVTHDRSAVMSSADWSTAACLLAHETNAAIIYVEWNFGRDMCALAIQTSWEALQRDGRISKKVLMPAIAPVRAKQGKLLRAEPVAQLMVQDKVRLRGVFTDMEREWATWMSTDPFSPGRIDASCILVYGLIPDANKGAVVHAPLPQAPQAGGVGRQPSVSVGAYGRRIGK